MRVSHRRLRFAGCVAVSMVVATICSAGRAGAEGTAQPPLKAPAPRPYVEVVAEKYFPGTVAPAPAARIFRLTRDQLDATVQSLLPSYFTQSVKSVMARDPLQTNYEYADLLTVNTANFGGLTGWLGEIAERVRKNPAGVVPCADAKINTACLDAQARSFAIRAFRGDVSDEKLKQIADFYVARVKDAGFEQGTGDLVEVVLNSPSFLFRQEIDADKDRARVQARRLQALTYTLGDAPPELFQLRSENATQYFRSGQEAAAALDKVITAPAAREKLKRFFLAWLEVKEPAEFTISPNYYPDFNATLATAMRAETDQFLDAQLSKLAPKLRDITQATPASQPANLAPIYGAGALDPIAAKLAEGEPPQRLGIFSLPAVLASHSGPTNTRPIKRGVFWGKKVMCMDMQSPPKDLDIDIKEVKGVTERQRIHQATQRSACVGCHKVINPLGFFQESYDAIGKWRTEDNGKPIDASVLIDFLGEGPPKMTRSPVDAIKTLTSSSMFKQCFVRQLFRFYMGRSEEPADDPVLRQMFLKFARTDQDILKTVYVLTSSDRLVKPQ